MRIKSFAAIFTVSLVVCAYVTYINDLLPVTLKTPEAMKNVNIAVLEGEKDYFKIMNMPVYMNLATYFSGAFIAYFYYDFKKNKKFHKKSWIFHTIFYANFLVALLIIISGHIFYTMQSNFPILNPVLASVLKNHTGIIIGIIILGLTMKYGGFLLNFLEHPLLNVWGKVTYSIYLIHVIFIYHLMAGKVYPIESSFLDVVSRFYFNILR